MLYVEANGKPAIKWYVGYKVPTYQNRIRGKISFDEVSMVQADGDELEWIHRNIEGIPKCKASVSRVQRWWGDDARYIAYCLPQNHTRMQA